MSREQLKQVLLQIKQNQIVIDEKTDYIGYGYVMLDYIGDPDSVLRDELIYELLDEWISNGYYLDDQLIDFMDICLDENHLLFHLGEKENLTVFTRTFSALILTSILEKHLVTSFLTKEQVIKVYEKAILFYEKEEDLRGYLIPEGWAHAAAHGADLLKALADCPELGRDELLGILQVIKGKICQGEYVYIDREPNRISRVIGEIGKRKLVDAQTMHQWVSTLENHGESKAEHAYFQQRVNIENFCRCLYFECKSKKIFPDILDKLEEKSGV